jgi:hypothetical protein
MTVTTVKLIANSYYTSGILARDGETMSGSQVSDGLEQLNYLLSYQSVKTDFIPYYSFYDLTLVTGQETYLIPNLVLDESVTFNIGPVRYAMSAQSRKTYWATGRVDNISSLPFNYRMDRVKGGTNLSVYFLPASNYPVKIFGKFSLGELDKTNLEDDLTETYDLFYIEYLTLELANRLCIFYNIQMPPDAAALWQDYRKSLKQLSAPDLTIRKLSSLKKSTGFTWADINIGKGYRPV